ncbi:MAG: TrbC/VirB2 family protein [Candidatus Niyogibacteria bacterium]|nr:TrbC/VirB2 family protein [Candidatus Niyogibacteria bacterium]
MSQLIHTLKSRLLLKTLAFPIVNLGLGVPLALAQSVTLDNPLKFNTFSAIIQEIAKIVTMVGLPVIALFIVYAGFLYVTARGNETKVKKAHDTLLWTVVGAAIIVGAYAIATAIEKFAQSLSAP